MARALIVFAKTPEPGRVKTRLTSFLHPGEAAVLYEAFLADALAQYQQLDADVRLYASPGGAPFPSSLVPDGVSLHRQEGAGLGDRMQRAVLDSFAAGYHAAVIVGTDHPTLPSAFVDAAFDALAQPLALTIGPSEDGGYYLIGMNDFYPEVFEDMTYSHAHVFDDTLDRAGRTRATITVLPVWYDVDTPGDLQRLVDDLPACEAPLRRTRAAVADLDLVRRLALLPL